MHQVTRGCHRGPATPSRTVRDPEQATLKVPLSLCVSAPHVPWGLREERERKPKGAEWLVHTHELASGMVPRGSAPVCPLLLWRGSRPAVISTLAKPPSVAIREYPAVAFRETRRAMASSGPFQIKSEANPSSNSNLARTEDWSQLPP